MNELILIVLIVQGLIIAYLIRLCYVIFHRLKKAERFIVFNDLQSQLINAILEDNEVKPRDINTINKKFKGEQWDFMGKFKRELG